MADVSIWKVLVILDVFSLSLLPLYIVLAFAGIVVLITLLEGL